MSNDNLEKTNKPEPFDPSQFGDLSDVKLPENFGAPKAKPKASKQPAKEAAKMDEPQDEATLFANAPAIEDQKKALMLAAGSEQIRNAITKFLQKEWPAAYAHYRSLKYPIPGTEPTLEQRKLAYEFAFRAFLKLTYTKSFSEGQG